MQFATGSPTFEIGIRLIRGSAAMDFQGVSNAAAAREKPIGLVTRRPAQITPRRSPPVGLLCKGIKITQRLIAQRQEFRAYR